MDIRNYIKKEFVFPRFTDILIRFLFLLFLFFKTASAQAQVAGDYGAVTSGSWDVATNWKIYNGVSWASSPVAGAFPNSAAVNCYIIAGVTITVPNSPRSCNNLYVPATGKLYTNVSNPLINIYLLVYGNITCDGIIGNGTTYDAISFGPEGTNCTFTGTGTFDCSRINKRTTTNATTNFIIDISINLRFASSSQTQIFNNASNTTFNVTVNAGKTLNLTGSGGFVGNVAMDGTSGADLTERGGSYTINGTLLISGILYLTTNNTTLPCSFTIGPTGIVETNTVITNASGSATHTFTMSPGGLLQIIGTPFTNTFVQTNNVYNLNAGSTIEYYSAGVQNVDTNITYANLKMTGGVNNATTTISGVTGSYTITVASVASLAPGMSVSGTGIAAGSTIQFISGTTLTLTALTTGAVSGTGTFTYGALTPNKNAVGTLTVKGNITIAANAVFNPNLKVYVGGNWTDYTQAGFNETGSTVEFNQSANDTIRCLGAGVGEFFNILKINKTGGAKVYLSSAPATIIRIITTLDLTSGNIVTCPVSLTTYYVRIQNTATVINVSDNSYVEGACGLELLAATPLSFTFPIGNNIAGKPAKYRPDKISGTPSATSIMLTDYIQIDPNAAGYPNTALDTGLDHVSHCEYWRFRSVGNATPNVFTLTLSWDTNSVCSGIVSLPDLRVACWNNPPANLWYNLGNSAYSPGPGSGTVTASQTTSFTSLAENPATLASYIPANTLPIHLLDFYPETYSDKVMLIWNTTSEINNDHFTLERSGDGYFFYPIAEIKGAGNSTDIEHYEYPDNHPLTGTSYYRLTQTDYDGKVAFCGIVSVRFKGKSGLSVFTSPVPAKDAVRVYCQGGSKTFTIQVIGLDGRLVRSVASSDEITVLNLEDISPGICFLRVFDASDTRTLRIIKE